MSETITCPICHETIGRGMKVEPMIMARTAAHVYSCPYCQVFVFPHKKDSGTDDIRRRSDVRKM